MRVRSSWSASLPLALFMSMLVGGCTSDEQPPPEAMEPAPLPPLEPPPAGQGLQYKMVTELQAGQEIERCQFVVAPPEGLNVNHDEVRYTPGSHHVLLYRTSYQAVPTVDLRGQSHDTSGVFDCALGATADWAVNGVIAGAQSFGGGSMVSLPPDVAVKVPGGAVMLMNTHYLNANPKPLMAEARINVFTIPAAQMKQEGGVLFFYNPIISIPAGGTATARMRCSVSSEILLTNIQSHMHRRAVNYEAMLSDKSGQALESLYKNDDWENVPVKKFEPGKVIPAGSSFDYHCDYKNTEPHDIRQGPSTKDEMCMLIGSYYPRNREIENCQKATWYGNGNKSCSSQLSCAVVALGGGNFNDVLDCVSDSCSSVGKQLTDALFCVLEQANTGCQAKCQGPGGGECQACIAAACQPATDACKAATCQ
ncbi:MAG TPA: hypothetical protein PLW65_10220 [Pseudomonadota bacterium]|nr:hypothetical protein [Pseudomonadota bacterium]